MNSELQSDATRAELLLKLQSLSLGSSQSQDMGDSEIDLLFSQGLEDRTRAVLQYWIEQGRLKPSKLLVLCVKNLRTVQQLMMMAQCLRFGATSDLYLEFKSGTNSLYLLGYLLERHLARREPERAPLPVLKKAVLLLCYYGANPSKKMYDFNKGFSSSVDPTNLPVTAGMSVLDYASSQGLQIFEGLTLPIRFLELDTDLRFVALLTSQASNMGPRILDSEVDVLIEAGCSVPDSISVPHPPLATESIDVRALELCLKCYNFFWLQWLVKKGFEPSYFRINLLLLELQELRDKKLEVEHKLQVQVVKMLLSAGIGLDSHQLELLKQVSPDNTEEFLEIFRRPYWSKICSIREGLPPPRLVPLIVGMELLNPESITVTSGPQSLPPLTVVCRDLEAISEMGSTEALIAINKKRESQMVFLHSKLYEIQEDEDLPRCTIISGENYQNYSSFNTASYRDENGQIWCYLSSSFERIIQTPIPVNPVTSRPLPQWLVQQMKNKLAILNLMGVEIDKPPTYQQIIQRLTEQDSQNDVESQNSLLQLSDRMALRGVSLQQLQSLQSSSLNAVLQSQGYSGKLDLLTSQHGLVTVARIHSWMERSQKLTERRQNLLNSLSSEVSISSKLLASPIPVGSLV